MATVDSETAKADAVTVRKLLTVYLSALAEREIGGGRRAMSQAGHTIQDAEAALRQFTSGGTSVAGAAGDAKIELKDVVPLTAEAITAAIEAEETRFATMEHARRVGAEAKTHKDREKFLDATKPGERGGQ